MNRWWPNEGSERYWLEAAIREDAGTNLRAPKQMKVESRTGDTVYSKRRGLETLCCTMTNVPKQMGLWDGLLLPGLLFQSLYLGRPWDLRKL